MPNTYRKTVLIALLAALALSCRKPAPAKPLLTAKSFVQVDFEGLIAHVLPASGSLTTRAVVLADDKQHLHNFVISIPPINENESDLDYIGTDHQCIPYAGCTITGINGITLSIENITPGLAKATSFTTFVPSLSDAFQSPIPESDLAIDLKNSYPQTADFLAYFDFTGGTLAAVPYCGQGFFKNGGSARRFVDMVTLTAEAPSAAATLKVTSKAGTHYFTFKDPDYIHILLQNMPINPSVMSDHFPIYGKLFSSGIRLPEVDHSLACPPKGTVVGCSDSTWP